MRDMRTLRKFALAAVSAALVMLVGAGNASGTVLEVGGTAKEESVAITASADTSITLARTDGTLTNTCTTSHVHGTTTNFTGTSVTGKITTLTFENCERTVEVVNKGALEITHIGGTTNGTVFSENATVRVGSPFGHLHCVTGETTHIGTLTGKASGNATMDIHAVLNCGFLAPSVLWTGSYWVTSPSGLGVLKETPPPPPTTTLEVEGVAKNEKVEITASLDTSLTLARTDGSLANTCTTSHVHGTTTNFTGTSVTGPISTLTFEGCERTVEVIKPGAFEITRIAGTTNGTVFSENATVRVGSPFGGTHLHCVTGETTHIGTLTGKKSGNATMDIHAVLNCGFLVPSATWTGSYWVTSPSGLGVTE